MLIVYLKTHYAYIHPFCLVITDRDSGNCVVVNSCRFDAVLHEVLVERLRRLGDTANIRVM